MSDKNRVVLLAAGRGQRMAALGADEPKSLLPIRDEPFAVRLIRQAMDHGVDDITVVVGYRKDYVKSVIQSHVGDTVRFVENDDYARDVNIHSLTLALGGDPKPFHVIEADIFLMDSCWPQLLASSDMERSIWYTRGVFQPHQQGGILSVDATGQLMDLRIVPEYMDKYQNHKKLVGITHVGPGQVERYIAYLRAYRDRDMRQYYLMPWINNLGELTAYECDLGSENAVSVNTAEEYRALLRMIDGLAD